MIRSGGSMFKRIVSVAAVLGLTVLSGLSISASTDNFSRPANLTVHEWGTFTTVAGVDGKPEQWLPLGGPSDLPCFVYHYQNVLFKDGPRLVGTPVEYSQARTQLLGSVRMETPVLYFYSPRAETVQVKVGFPQG